MLNSLYFLVPWGYFWHFCPCCSGNAYRMPFPVFSRFCCLIVFCFSSRSKKKVVEGELLESRRALYMSKNWLLYCSPNETERSGSTYISPGSLDSCLSASSINYSPWKRLQRLPTIGISTDLTVCDSVDSSFGNWYSYCWFLTIIGKHSWKKKEEMTVFMKRSMCLICK